MRRHSIYLVVVWVLLIMLYSDLPEALGTIIYDDGGVHTISSMVSEEVEVYDNSEGSPTTVNLVFGGSIGHRLCVLTIAMLMF